MAFFIADKKFFLLLDFIFQYCPVELSRFLPSVEMTRRSWFFMGVEVGGGEAAINLHS